MEAAEAYEEVVLAWSSPPPLTGSEWADEYRRVSSGPSPGQWSTARTPDLREPMDCVTDSAVEGIVVVKPTRSGGTEIINNAEGYFIHYDPREILYAQSTKDQGELYSDYIFMPMVRDTPVLAERIVRERGRKATQTKTKMIFQGGARLRIIGAKSPKGFQAIQAEVVIGDDLDEWEISKKGDPVLKLIDRSKGIWNRKIILVSYPTIEGVSRIWARFLLTDQRYRHAPCPLCSEFQILKFGGKDKPYGLKWDSPSSRVWYECEHCHRKIEEYHKDEMNRLGEWRAKEPFNGWAGFNLNPFLRSWHRWSEIRDTFLSCGSDTSKLMVFRNQTLGEVWVDDKGKRVTEDILFARREGYPAEVPMGVKLLTAAIDTHDNRLECLVMGWGPGEESWIIEHRIFNGSPVEESVWNALDNYLLGTFKHESGLQMEIKRVAIDTGGHHPTQVYEFTKSREGRGIYAVHGSNDPKADVLDGDKRINKGTAAKYQRIGVYTCKNTLVGRLKIEKPVSGESRRGYIHFPMSLDMEFFKQLLGEKPVITKAGKRVWQLVIGRRNEALDLHNYNLAALRMLRPDWEAIERGCAEDMGRKVYKPHQASRHLDPTITLKKEYPIVVCADFGKNPLVWLLAQTDGKKVWIFDELAVRNGDVSQMAVQVQRRYGDHKRGFIVYGGAAGSIRSSAGKSEYAIMKDYGLGRQRHKRLNPPEIDRINAVNNMLENIAGQVRLTYHPNCILLKRDFEQALWLEDMSDIDRTDFGRGNAADALGHFIVYEWPLRSARPSGKRFYK